MNVDMPLNNETKQKPFLFYPRNYAIVHMHACLPQNIKQKEDFIYVKLMIKIKNTLDILIMTENANKNRFLLRLKPIYW